MSEEKEYFGRFHNLTIVPGPVLAVALGLAIAGVFYAGRALSQPLAAATTGEARVVIHSEPCAFKDTVALTNRATWEEKGKVLEGCVGNTQFGVFIFYFPDDKSVFPAPKSDFTVLQNV